MVNYQQAKEPELEKLSKDFKSRIDMAADLFGDTAFMPEDSNGNRSKFSPPFYDSIIVSCDRLFDKKATLIKNKSKLKDKIEKALKDEETYELVIGRANTAESIKKRLEKIEGIFLSAI